MNDEIAIVPANQGGCEDLQAVFGPRGASAICQCQRYKLAPKEAFKSHPPETRSMFAAAGFTEVTHPTPRRGVMRIDLM